MKTYIKDSTYDSFLRLTRRGLSEASAWGEVLATVELSIPEAQEVAGLFGAAVEEEYDGGDDDETETLEVWRQ